MSGRLFQSEAGHPGVWSWVIGMMVRGHGAVKSRRRACAGCFFAEALPGELDAVGIVDEAIEDRVGNRWISDDFVPAVHGDLSR